MSETTNDAPRYTDEQLRELVKDRPEKRIADLVAELAQAQATIDRRESVIKILERDVAEAQADNAALVEAGRTFWSAVLGWRDTLSMQRQYNDSLDQDAKDSIDFILKRIAVEAGAFEQTVSRTQPGAPLLDALKTIANMLPPALPAPMPNLTPLWAEDQRLLYKAVLAARDAIRNREVR